MKLQLTNGYHVHFDQISRILQYLLMTGSRKKIPRKEIVAALGLSDRQVESIISMLVGFGLIKSRTSILTSLGKIIAEKDVYFERIETLWIVHYIISSNLEWVVWHRIVNQILPMNDRIVISDVAMPYFADLKSSFSERTLKEKLPGEIGAVLQSYAQSSLTRLNLLSKEQTGVYHKKAPVDIPPLAFLYQLLHFKEIHAISASALPIAEIEKGKDSPGVVLSLSEFALRELLNRVHDSGLVRWEQFGDLDQVRFPEDLSRTAVLYRIYGK
jgi:predicted transcriptional regulator